MPEPSRRPLAPPVDRDGVVYVGSEHGSTGVYEELSAKALARAVRHHQRSAAKQAKLAKSREHPAASADAA